ncbi:MAG: endonuclease, partial [Bacteroidota bacterium]
MKSDIHHLFPTYKNWNSTRSNYAFAEIDDNQTTRWMRNTSYQSSIPSSNIDEYSEYANGKFEPREDHKGNVARAVFYFYTMYPTQAGSITSVGNLNTLYQWHLNDPVDAAEIARNNAIEQYQGNRNPYIDQPNLVGRAWGFSDGGSGGGGGGGSVTYCASKGNSVADEWIQQVTIASINKSSGANGGYANFTSTSTSLAQGATVNITIKPAWSGSVYSEGYAIWIDFNKDGDFTDNGEQLFTRSATSSSTITGTISIPSLAATGTTRMRVSMKYNGVPSSCETFSYGEVEDYTVNIVTGSGSGGGNDGGSGSGNSSDLFISEYVEGSSYNK